VPDTTATQLWIPIVTAASSLLGSVVGGAAVVLGQHLSSSAERKAREAEISAAEERARKQFQAKTLMRIQERSVDLVDGTMKYLGTFTRLDQGQKDASLVKLHKTRLTMAMLRHRVKDDQLRGLIKELSLKVLIYLTQTNQTSTADAARRDLDQSLQALFDRLGEILRQST
jgi:hypothetical protein